MDAECTKQKHDEMRQQNTPSCDDCGLVLKQPTTEPEGGVCSLERVVGRLDATPRRCVITRTTDGCEYIAEFDDNQTAAIRHTVKYPDGREYSW